MMATNSSALNEAITRYKAAIAAYEATPDGDEKDTLGGAMVDALDDIAVLPCANDAELMEKLRYLFEEETRLFGGHHSYIQVVAALATHFGEEAAQPLTGYGRDENGRRLTSRLCSAPSPQRHHWSRAAIRPLDG